VKFHYQNIRLTGNQLGNDARGGLAFDDQIEFIASNLSCCRLKGILEFLVEGPSIVGGSRFTTYRTPGAQ